MSTRGDILRSAKRSPKAPRPGMFDHEDRHLTGPTVNRGRAGSAASFPDDAERVRATLNADRVSQD